MLDELKFIADRPSLFKALEDLMYKHAVKAKLDGAVMVEGILREISTLKTVEQVKEEVMPGR